MEDREQNGSQGELFNEIYIEHETAGQQIAKGPHTQLRNKKKSSFDAFLLLLIAAIVVVTIAYAVGFEKGRDGVVPIGTENGAEKNTIVEPVSVEEPFQGEHAEEGSVSPVVEEKAQAEEVQPFASQEDIEPATEATTYNWTIQIITYTSESHTEKALRALRAEGYEPFVIPSGIYYQVCVNKYETREAARKLLSFFRSEKGYRDAYVRKIRK